MTSAVAAKAPASVFDKYPTTSSWRDNPIGKEDWKAVIPGDKILDALATRQITLIVGPKKAVLKVAEGVLKYIPYFDGCFKNGFMEATEGKFVLPDENEIAVTDVMKWLIRGLEDVHHTKKVSLMAVVLNKWCCLLMVQGCTEYSKWHFVVALADSAGKKEISGNRGHRLLQILLEGQLILKTIKSDFNPAVIDHGDDWISEYLNI